VYGQTRRCLEIIEKAIKDVGGSLEDVTRTRVMLTDMSRWREAAQAHGEYFGKVRPASTFAGRSLDRTGLARRDRGRCHH
jgi:enamine deaminase RidA (YjgF/YER057c/UK114 family)